MSEQQLTANIGIGGKPQGFLTAALAPVSALLLSVSILLMGSGLQGTLLPVRANMESFSSIDLGLLGTAFFLGFTFGCIHGPLLVRRSGHIRVFLAMTSVASVTSLLHAVFVDPLTWWVLRAVTGYCFAVLYIVIESWLNAQSSNHTRGTVFAIYTAINLTVITAGQMMLSVSDPKSFTLFAVASILVSLAALPIAFTISASPTAGEFVRPRLGKLYAISPVAVAGCFAVGLANGAFWGLGAVFAQNENFTLTEIAAFMSAVVLGGALLQWPLGSISDRMDRRIVIVVAASIALVAALAISLMPFEDKMVVVVIGAIFGAGAFPLNTLSVAHANDFSDSSECVEVSSGLLLVYAIGATIGPLLAALLQELSEAQTLFYFTAGVHAVLIGYVIWRMTRREAAPADDRAVFYDVAIAAQTVMPFDPIGPADAPGPADENSEQAEAEAEADMS
jgi:MFS family permease